MSFSADGKTLELHASGNRCVKVSTEPIMYGEDIIRYFDHHFNAVAPSINASEQIVDYSQPNWHTLKPSGVRLHFVALAEPDSTTQIYLEKAALSPGQIVLDLGAYCGGSSIFFAREVGPNGHVIAFEPDPRNYASLNKNIEYHRLRNITPIQLAVWSHSGTLSFQGEGNLGSGVAETHARNDAALSVEATTLSEIVKNQHLERIDFIKMDIEGAETEVLSSSLDVLKRFHPRLIIEAHEVKGKLNADEIVTILTSIGYTCELLPQGDLPMPLIFATIPS